MTGDNLPDGGDRLPVGGGRILGGLADGDALISSSIGGIPSTYFATEKDPLLLVMLEFVLGLPLSLLDARSSRFGMFLCRPIGSRGASSRDGRPPGPASSDHRLLVKLVGGRTFLLIAPVPLFPQSTELCD